MVVPRVSLNRPEFPETRLVSQPGRAETASCGVVNLLGLARGEVVDRLVGSVGVDQST
jgi:hypothetical protein